MNTLVSVVNEFNPYIVELTTRIKTAVEMCRIINSINTEQETTEPYDSLKEEMNEYLKQFKYNIGLEIEFFTGIDDVIFILKLYIRREDNDYKNEIEIKSEKILGTVLNKLADYFQYSYRLDLDDYSTKSISFLETFKVNRY